MKQDLARTLTQTDLVLLLVGTVIGSGIFLVPGGVLQQSGGHVGLAPLLFILAAGAIVLNTVIAQPGRALVGFAVVLLGVPAYVFWSAKLKASMQTAGRAPRM